MGILRGALSEEEQAILQLCDEYENQKTDDKMVQQARTQKTNLMKRLKRWYQTQGTEIWPPSNILNSARDFDTIQAAVIYKIPQARSRLFSFLIRK
jgi:hypothetical protein